MSIMVGLKMSNISSLLDKPLINLSLSLSLFGSLSLSELIYKEVMNFEERTKNGVVKGQPSPSGTLTA